jgi:small-conductance mechanosensitive channel
MEEIEEVVVQDIWASIQAFFEYQFNLGKSVHINVLQICIVLAVFVITTYVLRFVRRIVTKKLPEEDKPKFNGIFSFARYFIYVIVVLITFDNVGVNVTAIFAASAALLVGVGLALQTLFQDIISGVFILVDQTVHVGDIIELDGKIGRVEKINLRTTKAVTIDNKVLVIPNHIYLTSILYNWTENGTLTRESIDVGVAYGSDVQLVKKLLLQVANEHPETIKDPPPRVIFANFGDSSLDFKLVFSMGDSFTVNYPKSDMRFEIDRLFRENNVTIPFPQRDVHLFNQKK